MFNTKCFSRVCQTKQSHFSWQQITFSVHFKSWLIWWMLFSWEFEFLKKTILKIVVCLIITVKIEASYIPFKYITSYFLDDIKTLRRIRHIEYTFTFNVCYCRMLFYIDCITKEFNIYCIIMIYFEYDYIIKFNSFKWIMIT